MPNTEYVIFEVDSCKFALPSVVVDRVERAVQLTPVPDAPVPVLGVVNYSGDVVPVLGLWGRIGGEERDVILSDRLIFSSANGRRMALVADRISDVIEIDDKATHDADEIWPGISLLKSLAGMGTDVVLVQDMSKLLDPEQEMDLLAAIAAMNEAEDSAADD
ncbi:chemotaxis protein CheW [Maridesulfovibrio salexigens]|uniref:CheW protein n=1 Tax=Maridesulfovibrio salexigens (strain ATCC 14822 / DSM 2638 / NCIMB 8403 / VKM B-1763) TaxID=526222 RepID=C6C1V3_MARSD|nr:chemotaxis protein CheW [Maridesulfovibrio salexigens]ACS79349.1 CheW protein [Maridesulfovibrio salexigens DSM 2638]